MKIFAISGSLRAQSTNTLLLKEALRLAPDHVDTVLFEGLNKLPHFNPDLDTEAPPSEVQELRDLLKSSQALLICSPEYAHGVPGSLKNALDWLVSSGELDGMPVGLLNASPSLEAANFAQQSLQETLRVMSNNIIPEAVVRIGAVRTKISADGKITDGELKKILGKVVTALVDAAESKKQKKRNSPTPEEQT